MTPDEATPARGTGRLLEFASTRAVVVIVTIALVAVTTFLGVDRAQEDQRAYDREMAAAGDLAVSQISERMLRAQYEAETLRALFFASTDVNRAEFAAFVRVSLNRAVHDRVLALEWAPMVMVDELAAFEAEVRADTTLRDGGYPDFNVRPEPTLPVAYPVIFVEPLDENLSAFGLDLAFDDARRLAIERARDTGEVVMTEPVELVQTREPSTGLILLGPVYADSSIPPTTADRVKKFAGVTLVVLGVQDLLVYPSDDDRINIHITDVISGRSVLGTAPTDPGVGVQTHVVRVLDRDWRVEVTPTGGRPAMLTARILLPPLAPLGLILLLFLGVGRGERRVLARERAAADRARALEQEAVTLAATRRSVLDTVSHELKTPTTAIIGFTDLLLGHRVLVEDPEARLIAERIATNSRLLHRLVNDMLGYSRLGSTPLAPHAQPEDLAEQTRVTLDSMSSMLGGHTIERDLSPAPVLAESMAIQRVVSCLVDNVVQHTPSGCSVTVSVGREGDDAVLAFDDDGPGVGAELMGRAFEPFTRGTVDRTAGVPGTGLGLAVVQGLAERHGGTASLTTSARGGVRVEVRLPSHDPGDERPQTTTNT